MVIADQFTLKILFFTDGLTWQDIGVPSKFDTIKIFTGTYIKE